jgi:hypothetical protein
MKPTVFFTINCCKLNKILALAEIGVSLQSTNAFWAAATAASISSTVVSGVKETTSPVA